MFKYLFILLFNILHITTLENEEYIKGYKCVYICSSRLLVNQNHCEYNYLTLQIQDDLIKNSIKNLDKQKLKVQNFCEDKQTQVYKEAQIFCQIIKCGSPNIKNIIVFNE